MYSDFHPVQRDAWLHVHGKAPVHFQKHVRSDHALYSAIRPHLTYPRQPRLQSVIDRYAEEIGDQVTVELYELSLDLETRELKQNLLTRVTTESTDDES